MLERTGICNRSMKLYHYRTTRAGVVERMNERAWQHPIHARGIKSQPIPVTLGLLSDRRINFYSLQGYYSGRSERYVPCL
jgi:hypothetical protein